MLSSKSFVVLYSSVQYSTVRCTTMHTQRLTSSEASPNVSSTRGGTGAKTRSTAPIVRRRWRVQLISTLPDLEYSVSTWGLCDPFSVPTISSPAALPHPRRSRRKLRDLLPCHLPRGTAPLRGIARPLTGPHHLLPRPPSTQPTVEVGTTGRSIQ